MQTIILFSSVYIFVSNLYSVFYKLLRSSVYILATKTLRHKERFLIMLSKKWNRLYVSIDNHWCLIYVYSSITILLSKLFRWKDKRQKTEVSKLLSSSFRLPSSNYYPILLLL